ncbi:proteasome assembly chaperone 3 isoform X2 [Pseudophryne corroboree]
MNTPTMDVKPAVVSKQAEEVINGIATQVVCSAFDDHILVVVTQYGKMGTLVSVTPNVVSEDLGKPTLTTKVLLGCDEPIIHVCAKNLVSFVSQESKNKPIILSIALKDRSADCIKTLKGVIKSCQVW